MRTLHLAGFLLLGGIALFPLVGLGQNTAPAARPHTPHPTHHANRAKHPPAAASPKRGAIPTAAPVAWSMPMKLA